MGLHMDVEHSTSTLPALEQATVAHTAPTSWIERVGNRLHRSDFGVIALIFILGFIIRAHLMRYELFFEFDSYWHARMVSYILQGLPAPTMDPLAYYQNPVAASFANPPLFFWYASVAVYKIFTLNAAYSQELWIFFVKIIPALFGALTSVAMFFLGKELFKGKDEKMAGLLAGILVAVMPAFVYRTMGGFFEDDSFGFLWMAVGFVFFVKAVRNPEWKRNNIIDAILAGVSFGLMALSWSGFNQLVPILLGIGFVQFLIWTKEGELKKADHYARLWLISFGLLAVFATLQSGLFWLDQFGGITGIVLGLRLGYIDTLAVILALFLFSMALFFVQKRLSWGPNAVKKIFFITILFLVLVPLVVNFFNVSLRTGDVLGQTIGEESDGKNYFGNKYNFMVLFAILGIPIIGYLLWKHSRHYEFLTIPLVWVVVTFFMAWGKLKFTYYWGIPLALIGAVLLVILHRHFARKSIRTQKIVALAMGFILMGGIASGVIFVTQNVPNIEASAGWKTALFWSNQNLPEDAKFFNWWDEGHWITFLSQRGVIIDNRNVDVKASADVALFMITPNPAEAMDLVQKHGSTHLIFGDDLLTKMTNLGFFAYDITSAADPRIQGLSGAMFFCSRNVTTLTKEVSFKCGENTFTSDQLESFPTVWTQQPTVLQDGAPLYLYHDEGMTRLYAFSTKANNAMLVRLWFDDPSLDESFPPLYSNTGGVRIWGVNPGIGNFSTNPPVEVINESPSIPLDSNVAIPDANGVDANSS